MNVLDLLHIWAPQILNLLNFWEVKFIEFNAQANIDQLDNTYLRNIADNKMEKDIEIWENSISQRIIEANKLKNSK